MAPNLPEQTLSPQSSPDVTRPVCRFTKGVVGRGNKIVGFGVSCPHSQLATSMHELTGAVPCCVIVLMCSRCPVRHTSA